jgi:hypothetical protein
MCLLLYRSMTTRQKSALWSHRGSLRPDRREFFSPAARPISSFWPSPTMSYPLPLPPPTAGDGTPSGSASVMVAGSASSYHVLKIDRYLWTKHAIPNGNYVDSRPFCVAGLTWAIRYYPNERRLHLSLPRPQDQGRRGCHGAVLAKLINEVEASQVRAVSARRFSAQILA